MRTLRRPRSLTRRLKIALAVVGGLTVVAVFAVAVFALALSYTFDSRRHVVDAFPAAVDRPAATTGRAAKAVNILLLGTDVDSADPESPQFVGKREADTVMLLHVPADRSKVYAVSILRNSLVDVPGHGMQAINSAYAFGGVKLQVQTVEQLLDVRVDHVVDVSLTGLADLTDALGGVPVQNPKAFSNDGVDFRAGSMMLDGTQALAYLRAGDFRAEGDGTRAAAQEQYFRGVLKEVLSAKLLLDPTALSAGVDVFAPYLSTDKGFDANTVVGLGVSMRNLRASDLVTLRTASTGVTKRDGATVVDLDPSALQALSRSLRTDSLSSYSG